MKNSYNFDLFKKDLEDRKQMVLFVGAGINYSKDVKILWDDVINYLFEKTLSRHVIGKNISTDDYCIIKKALGIDSILSNEEIENGLSIKEIKDRYRIQQNAMFELNPLIKASIVKSTLGDSYISFIQHYLYRQCNRTILQSAFNECYALNVEIKIENRRFYTLYQIARMIILCPFVKAVVTYNYDNYLRLAIDILWTQKDNFFTIEELDFINKKGRKNLVVSDISNNIYEHGLSEADLFIYHVHGYIPSPSEADSVSCNNIVLSLEEYYEDSRNVHTWQTATQLHFLSHYTCLFAGLSLSDITTQRMLYYTKHCGNEEKIYHICSYNPPDDFTYKTAYHALMDMKYEFHSLYGLTPIFAADGYDNLYERIGNVINEILVKS